MGLLNTVDSLKASIKNIIPIRYHFILDEIYYRSIPIRGVIREVFYLGNQVTCPCCNHTFKQFLDVKLGAKTFKNEKCPRCESFSRQRVMWLYLKNKTNLFSKKLRFLHIAPESCFQVNFKKMTNLHYISADLSSPLAQVKMDITKIPYEDNYFDVIFCNHVLEHIPDDHQAMKELFRVLQPTGWAILQVPIDINRAQTFEDPTVVSPEERERLFWQWDHVRLYGLDYKDRLEKVGFSVKVEDYVKELENNLIEQYRLEQNQRIYFCTKSIASTS